MRTLTAAAVAMGLLAPTAHAAELKLATFTSPNHPYQEAVFEGMAKRVADATNGDVTIRVYASGELGAGPVQQYNRAIDGVADITFSILGATASNFPVTLLTELPGVVTEAEGTKAVLDNIAFSEDEFKRVELLGLWTSATNVLFMRDKPVRSLADLKGLKIRAPSKNSGRVLEAWGATPVSMAIQDVYTSMQTGVVDGAFIDASAVDVFKLQEVTKYITVGMNGTMSSFFIVMNRDSFADLSDTQKAAVVQAGRDVSVVANDIQLSGARHGLELFEAAEGKEVIRLSDEAVAEFNAASDKLTEAVIAEVETEGHPARAYVEALRGN